MTHFKLSALSLAAMLLTACASTPQPDPQADSERVRLQSELAAAKADQARLSSQVASLQDAARAAAAAPAPVAPAAPAAKTDTDALSNARPGECYARVVNPPLYEAKAEKVLAKAASERVEIIPAKFEMVDDKVMIKPAGKKVVGMIPAVYKTVEEKVLIKAESEKIEQIPATYKTVEEKQMVKPATTMWKKGHGPIEKVDNLSGEIMCLVEIPAEYRIVKSRVVDTPASVKRIVIPAEYTIVKRQELVTPAQVQEVDVPAEYKTVKVMKMTSPAQEKRIPIEAEYQTVQNQVLVREGSSSWKSILCETNTTRGVVEQIQRALLAKKFNPGPIDGIIGTETSAAIRAFQQANGLATGGLTIETLDKLGVSRN